MLDLYHTTRDELIAQVLRERDTVVDRDRRIAALEVELAQALAMLGQMTAQVGHYQWGAMARNAHWSGGHKD